MRFHVQVVFFSFVLFSPLKKTGTCKEITKATSTRIRIYFKKGDFFSVVKKMRVRAYHIQIVFSPVHQKKIAKKNGNYDSIFTQWYGILHNGRSIWCSKTSLFGRPQLNEKPMFSKISTLLSVLKRCIFRDPFHRIRVDSRPNQW